MMFKLKSYKIMIYFKYKNIKLLHHHLLCQLILIAIYIYSVYKQLLVIFLLVKVSYITYYDHYHFLTNACVITGHLIYNSIHALVVCC